MHRRLLIAAGFILASFLRHPASAIGRTPGEDDVCATSADYSLGTENYPDAIRLHGQIIATHPDDALAHYHRGFALGMLGRHLEELAEYREAIRLGLKKWDLFLNLGRVYLEQGDLAASTGAFTTAVSLGPDHAEAHFNLGLAYERRGMIASAEQQMLIAVRLDPGQADARNMLGLVYAEEGDFLRARKIWTDLARTDVDFEPARRNLAVLDSIDHLSAKGLSQDTANFRTASSGVPRYEQDFCRRGPGTQQK
jgi:tetratricopeptide (TPR) repeat protein